MATAFASKCRGKVSLKTSDKKGDQTLTDYQGWPGNLPAAGHSIMAPTWRMKKLGSER